MPVDTGSQSPRDPSAPSLSNGFDDANLLRQGAIIENNGEGTEPNASANLTSVANAPEGTADALGIADHDAMTECSEVVVTSSASAISESLVEASKSVSSPDELENHGSDADGSVGPAQHDSKHSSVSADNQAPKDIPVTANSVNQDFEHVETVMSTTGDSAPTPASIYEWAEEGEDEPLLSPQFYDRCHELFEGSKRDARKIVFLYDVQKGLHGLPRGEWPPGMAAERRCLKMLLLAGGSLLGVNKRPGPASAINFDLDTFLIVPKERVLLVQMLRPDSVMLDTTQHLRLMQSLKKLLPVYELDIIKRGVAAAISGCGRPLVGDGEQSDGDAGSN